MSFATVPVGISSGGEPVRLPVIAYPGHTGFDFLHLDGQRSFKRWVRADGRQAARPEAAWPDGSRAGAEPAVIASPTMDVAAQQLGRG